MSASDHNEPEALEKGLSRRTVVKGMAWSVPVVAMSSAVPAYAVTGPPPQLNVLTACKQPGGSCADLGFIKGYTFLVSITNPDPSQVVYIYTDPSGPLPPQFFADTSNTSNPDVLFTYGSAVRFDPFTETVLGPVPQPAGAITPGETVYLLIDAGVNDNSANLKDVCGYLFFAWGHCPTPNCDPDHPYTPLPPDPGYGEGWFGDQWCAASFPPCGPDCFPDINGAA